MRKSFKINSIILLKAISFIVIFSFIFGYVTELTQRKSLSGAWDMSNKIGGFYNEPDNEFDILFLGSSHAYCSFSPSVIYQETGLKSYVFASQLQPIAANYFYLKEALKKQQPKIVVLEVFSAVFDYQPDSAIIHSYTDDLPLSLNKAEMIIKTVPQSEWAENFLPIIKYHSRWQELTDLDYNFDRSKLKDPFKGQVLLTEKKSGLKIVSGDDKVVQKLRTEDEIYLKKIAELCQQEGIELILVKTPTTDYIDYQARVNYLKQLAEKLNLVFLDYNVGDNAYRPDLDNDFYDTRHLNIWGSKKFMAVFMEQISSRLEAKKNLDQSWQDDFLLYQQLLENNGN